MIQQFGSFKLHMIEGHIADLYIAEYPDSLLILDCGCRSDNEIFAEYITDTIGRSFSTVKLLVVTHPHPDHAGSSMIMSKKYGVPVAAPEDINLWYKGYGGRIQHAVDTFLAHVSARSRRMKLRRVSYPRCIDVDYYLKDSDTLPGFDDWRAFSVPGHTEYDMVLYNKRESLLYCADTIIRIRDKFLSPFPVTDSDKMRTSLKRLGALDVKFIAMAHGGIYKTADFSLITDGLVHNLDTPLTGVLKLFHPLTLFPHPLKKKGTDR